MTVKGKKDAPSEERCADCRYFTLWSGPFAGPGGYPACSHGGGGPRCVNLLDKMERCPLDDD